MNELITAEERLPETDDEVLVGYDHFRCSKCSQKPSNTIKTITPPVCNEPVPFYILSHIISYNYRNYYSNGLNYVKNIETERS